MKKNHFFIFLSIITKFLLSQNEDPINTDRPDQSDGTYILPTRNFQIENGIYFESNTLLNNLMIRQGITGKTELRFLCDFGKIYQLSGVLPMGIGMKQKIIKPKNPKFIPAITLSGYYYFGRLSGDDFTSSKNNYNLILAFQNDFFENFSLGYNIGSNDISNRINITTYACFIPVKKITLFLEYFAFFERNKLPCNNTDFGILYHLKNNLQIDIAVGLPIQNTQVSPYFSSGFSWRANW